MSSFDENPFSSATESKSSAHQTKGDELNAEEAEFASKAENQGGLASEEGVEAGDKHAGHQHKHQHKHSTGGGADKTGVDDDVQEEEGEEHKQRSTRKSKK